MDSSLCLYKGKLKEAITLVTKMNDEKKSEAVRCWNQTAFELQNIVYKFDTNYTDELTTQQELHIPVSNDQSLYDTCQNSTLLGTMANEAPLVDPVAKSNLIQDQFHQENLIDKTLYDNTYMSETTVPRLDDCKTQISNLIDEGLTGNGLNSIASTATYAIAQTETSCTTSGSLVQLTPLDSHTTCSSTTGNNPLQATKYTIVKNSVDGMLTPTHQQTLTTNKSIIAPDLLTTDIFCSEVQSNNHAASKPHVMDYIAHDNNGNLSTLKVTTAVDGTEYNNILVGESLVARTSETDEIGNGQYDRGPKIFDEADAFQQHFESQQDVNLTLSHHVPSTRSELFTHTDRPLQEIQPFGSNYYDPYMAIIGRNDFKYSICNKQLDNPNDLIRHKQINSPGNSLMTPSSTNGEDSDTSKVCTTNNNSIIQIGYNNNVKTIPSTSTSPITKKVNAISNNQHTCEVCGKSGFSTKGNLKRHLRAHSGEKPFKCDFCESCFTEKKSLKIHVRRHTGEKPYKCQICGKLFSQTGVLQSHMALHLNERKFECDKCGKAFRQRSQLKLHLMRHDGVKRLECTNCFAKFLTKGDLERHYRIHTGERPYQCMICDKTFTRQQSLNEHMNRHTGRKPYDCKYCEKTFSEMSACYKHAKTHKKQDHLIQQQQQQLQFKHC